MLRPLSWHYLHIVDTLETAREMGVKVRSGDGSAAKVAFDPYEEIEIEPLIETSLDVSFAVNNLNRSMGGPLSVRTVAEGAGEAGDLHKPRFWLAEVVV